MAAGEEGAEEDDLQGAPDFDGGSIEDLDALLSWLKRKTVMSDEEFYALESRARAKAFTVSGVADLDVVSDVWRAVDSAVENGETLEDFRGRVLEDLQSEWGGEIPGRIETIFRTNVQSSYSAGRYQLNNNPAVKATHPYSKFSAILDGRTSDICAALDGTVLHSDDAFWASHQPPLHFNCRSDVTAITEEEAKEYGVDDAAPEGEADDGFGQPLAEYEPDLGTRPPELVSLYELKLR